MSTVRESVLTASGIALHVEMLSPPSLCLVGDVAEIFLRDDERTEYPASRAGSFIRSSRAAMVLNGIAAVVDRTRMNREHDGICRRRDARARLGDLEHLP